GSRDAVDQALSRLTREQTVRRLARGLYWYPRRNRRLGIDLSPDPDQIANALARRTRTKVAPSGAVAANRLGLSTQVPSRPVYLTNGRSREIQVGDQVFVLRHVPAKSFPAGNPLSTAVIQALKYLGPDAVDDTVINKLRRRLNTKQKKQFLSDARYATDWIATVARKVAADTKRQVSVDG
ncbi:MAG: DUF6088 family protein, partial [Pirellulaceae bacterium]